MRSFCLLLWLSLSFVSRSQAQDSLTCADVKNGGIFYFYGKIDGEHVTFTRNGTLQKEVLAKKKQTFLWEVNWLDDCSYTLKYISGAELLSKADQEAYKKHLIAVRILHVTEDYLVFQTSFDNVTSPALLTDTMWIKQRRTMKNKVINNPRADSIARVKGGQADSSHATLYVYRPAKPLNAKMTYQLSIDSESVCTVTNGCRITLMLLKMGVARISADVNHKEEFINVFIKPGGVYYLQCLCAWGPGAPPILMLKEAKEGKPAFAAPN